MAEISEQAIAAAFERRVRETGFLGEFWERFSRSPLAVAGLVVVVLTGLVAIFAPWISPYDPIEQNLRATLQPQSAVHWLGTDHLGRDVLARVIYGARVSMYIGLLTTGIALAGGLPLGLISGYMGGTKVDELIMRLVDAILAFPSLVLALAIAAMAGPGLIGAMVAISITGIPTFARLLRGQVLSVRENDYVMAARVLGAGPTRISMLHVFPNCLSPIIVQASLYVAFAILIEASLSFLGLGVQPPEPTWGSMLRIGYGYLIIAPWLSIWPGAAIFVLVLGINLFGDGLRDVLDPRLRGR
ncbi:MAG: ABC transporter permease [Chloroflexi bacterium]|nr:ABC transporter permease [Chloroflexota bacterium]